MAQYNQYIVASLEYNKNRIVCNQDIQFLKYYIYIYTVQFL